MTTSPFAVRGVIEGFYGRPWTHEQRLGLIDFLAQRGMNAFVYSPKDDPLVREEWRAPYDGEALRTLTELVDRCRTAGMELTWCISPGLSIRYSDAGDLEALKAKMRSVMALGVTRLGLFLDDIPGQLQHAQDRAAFSDLDQAHVALVREVFSSLPTGTGLIVCPTTYWGTGTEQSLATLGEGLDPRIDLFWTGRAICSATLDLADAMTFARTANRPPTYWDNYPVNDVAMGYELHIGPYRGRDPRLWRAATGVVANGMELFEASRIPFATIADYLRDPEAYEPETSWQRAMRDVVGEADLPAFAVFADNVRSSCLEAGDAPIVEGTLNAALFELEHGDAQAAGADLTALADRLLGAADHLLRGPVTNRQLMDEIRPWLLAFEIGAEAIRAMADLAGELAVGFIDGVQSQGIGTSLKHLAVNNQETRRMTVSAEVDERTLREIYLPAFEAAVTRARPWMVMCAYNRINGTYGSEHRELQSEILRDEWGFKGLVVSDWGAVHDRPAALAAGLDLEMPGPRPRRVQAVVDAVRAEDLDETILDEAARRIIGIVLRAAETPKETQFDAAAHHALARRVAAQGMVLLKNDGILPLDHVDRIAVVGRAAREAHLQGEGSSHVTPTRVDVPLDELAHLAGGAVITYAEGYPGDDQMRLDLIDEAVSTASEADVALLYVALPGWKETEGRDRTDLDLTAHQVALIRAVTAAQPRTVVILNNGSAIAMSDWIDGAAAVLEAWMMGQAGGGAIADIVFGVVNPSGRLAETFPLALEDTPAYLGFPGEADVARYGEGLFVGYRAYDARRQAVLFPFGHGLSYTTFEYESPRVSTAELRDLDGVTVSVDVTNRGGVAGAEVVQVYVSDREASLARPPKELKGFARVELAPGETRTVDIVLDFRAFAFYHAGYGRWITEDGEFDLLIGTSAADIRFVETVRLTSSLELPILVDEMSTPADWLAHPRARPPMEALLRELAPVLAQAFIEPLDSANPPQTLDDFLLNMPVRDVLEFAAVLGGPDPDTAHADLLAAIAET